MDTNGPIIFPSSLVIFALVANAQPTDFAFGETPRKVMTGGLFCNPGFLYHINWITHGGLKSMEGPQTLGNGIL